MHTPDATSDKQKDLTVYFDGSCPMCRAEIGVYKSSEGAERICFVNAAALGQNLPAGLDPASALARFHVRDAAGQLHSGAAGFSALWLTLPRWRWLGRIIALPGIRTAAELSYRGFLRIRPSLQRAWRRFGSNR